jgi:hypothetical protein
MKPVQESIAQMVHHFKRLNLEPPKVIEVSALVGRNLMLEMDGYMVPDMSRPPQRPHVVTVEGLPTTLAAKAVDLPYEHAEAVMQTCDRTVQTFMQAEIMGVKVRWPATAEAKFSGGTVLY